MRDFREVITHNPEPYNSILNFIKFEVIPKYPCLTSVYQSNFDEEGNHRIQYYIRYAADLSLEEWNELSFQIEDSVEKFCISSGVDYSVYSEIDFFVTVDGDYYEKYGKGF
ncbi:MAG: hypothetical protein IJI96_06370 [Methanobrevibacter sp.]|nr:hypothetical protein [Methanobrevibacter sp.]MBQ6628752.1 hypothetical protein [Methanobrevibacter sp.]